MWLWILSALAAPIDIHWVGELPTPDELDEFREELAGQLPQDADGFRLLTQRDGTWVRLEQLMPKPPPAPRKGANFRSNPVSQPGRVSGFLSHRAVYLSQSHGWMWSEALDRFATQRGAWYETVEDFHNAEGANAFLTSYLENAGGMVYTARERDPNPNLAIVDNFDVGYSEDGDGFQDGNSGFGKQDIYEYGDNPFRSGGTRQFPADGGGVVRWQVTVPEDGVYSIYVSWNQALNYAEDAHYRIIHPGGVIDRIFDQTVHGFTWQHVERMWLPAGDSLTVELIADSAQAGRWLNADAVRIGGGMGFISRDGELSGRPRWEEGGALGVQYNGAPSVVYDPYGDGDGSEPSSRSLWAAWEYPPGEDAVYLSWHSNGCNGCTARGTVTYYFDNDCGTPPLPSSEVFAEVMQDEIISAIQSQWDENWNDRDTNHACFSELDTYYNSSMPSILVELAFHDQSQDAAHLKNPAFRQDVARAMYRGIVRYFAERDGVTPTYLPEPPQTVRIHHSSTGSMEVHWTAPQFGEPWGDPATSYIVYTSRDGRSWDNGTAVNTTFYSLEDQWAPIYVRVVAKNEGGVSFPSETVAARRSPDGIAPILLVEAFNRYDTVLLDKEHVPNVGTLVRFNPWATNTGDILVSHAQALEALGWPYESTTDEALDQIPLTNYRLIIWAAGEEGVSDETISTEQQTTLRAFVENGGALWITGSEILWDLDADGDPSDRIFAEEILGASLDVDNANTDQVLGEDLLADLILDFGQDAGGPYPVELPDAFDSSRTVIARYDGGKVAGILGERVALFGFPFETIADAQVRASVTERLIPALVPDYIPPEYPIEEPDSDTNSLVDDTNADSGLDSTPTDTLDPSVNAIANHCGCTSLEPVSSGFGFIVVLATYIRRKSIR